MLCAKPAYGADLSATHRRPGKAKLCFENRLEGVRFGKLDQMDWGFFPAHASCSECTPNEVLHSLWLDLLIHSVQREASVLASSFAVSIALQTKNLGLGTIMSSLDLAQPAN